VSKSSNIEVLSGVALFEGFSKRELRFLADQTREVWFNPGQDIVREGGKAGGVFVIAEGNAKLIVGGRARKTLGPGACIGEMSLLDGAPRSATVRANTRLRALQVTSWNFLALLEENWSMARKVMAELSRRVRALEKGLID
jgi:CRP-like cAMP-binding protein